MQPRRVSSLAAVSFCLSTVAFGEQERTLEVSALLASRANPLGLSLQVDLSKSLPLFESDSIFLERNFVRPVASATVSPARALGGLGLVFQPFSVLGFKTTVQGLRTFGTFGNLQSFPNTSLPWDDDDLAKRVRDAKGVEERGDGEASGRRSGHVFHVSSYVQFKVGRVLGRTEGGVTRTWYRLPPGASVFYDPGEDLLLRNGAYSTFVNADALVERFLVDALTSGVSLRTFDARAYGAPRGVRLRNARVGPTLLWTFAEGHLLALLAHWYAIHPYRAKGTRAAVPSVALAYEHEVNFSFDNGARSDAPAAP
jgi:hypothetical protein